LTENTVTTTPRLVKSQTQVNTTEGGTGQAQGQIAPLADGGYVVVWADFSATYNPEGGAIVAQRYDSAGNKVGGEVKISQFSSGSQSTPAITALPNGNVAVAFVDAIGTPTDLNIYVRIFGPGGASLSLVRTDVIDIGPNWTFNLSITAFADSSYVISYTLQNSQDDWDIVARVVSAAGAVGARFDIDHDTDRRDLSEVATLSNGNFVVTYVDEFDASPTNTDILYRIFTPAGTPVTGRTTVPGGEGLVPETEPDVAALRNGSFVIVWTDPGDSNVYDIRASILSNAGSLVAGNILVNTTTAGKQDEPNVLALPDGGFLVTWEDGDTATNPVRAQRFDAAGNKIGTEFIVKNTGISNADSPEAALLADGGRIAYALGDVSTGDFDVTTSVWRARDVSHDFDGDGKSGVLWRHDSGQVYFWEMNGLGVKAEGAVAHAPVPNDWHIQGAGDFDGDGNNDVLWRHGLFLGDGWPGDQSRRRHRARSSSQRLARPRRRRLRR
jgi:FG-GAP-like repeat